MGVRFVWRSHLTNSIIRNDLASLITMTTRTAPALDELCLCHHRHCRTAVCRHLWLRSPTTTLTTHRPWIKNELVNPFAKKLLLTLFERLQLLGLPMIILPDSLRSTSVLMELSSNLLYPKRIIVAEQTKLANCPNSEEAIALFAREYKITTNVPHIARDVPLSATLLNAWIRTTSGSLHASRRSERSFCEHSSHPGDGVTVHLVLGRFSPSQPRRQGENAAWWLIVSMAPNLVLDEQPSFATSKSPKG